MNDIEAWQELADVYLELMDYNRAAYCYEHIIIFNQNPHFVTTLAEILYIYFNNIIQINIKK